MTRFEASSEVGGFYGYRFHGDTVRRPRNPQVTEIIIVLVRGVITGNKVLRLNRDFGLFGNPYQACIIAKCTSAVSEKLGSGLLTADTDIHAAKG